MWGGGGEEAEEGAGEWLFISEREGGAGELGNRQATGKRGER